MQHEVELVVSTQPSPLNVIGTGVDRGADRGADRDRERTGSG